MNWKFRGYLKETRRPVYSAALILPFLCIYHAGTLVLHTTYINGADALIIRILSLFSVHSMLGSALVLVICFSVWQLRTRASWSIKAPMLLLYFLESVCFALILLFAFGWFNTHLTLALNEARRRHFRSGALLRSGDLRGAGFSRISPRFSDSGFPPGLCAAESGHHSRRNPGSRAFFNISLRWILGRPFLSEASSSDSWQVFIFPSFL